MKAISSKSALKNFPSSGIVSARSRALLQKSSGRKFYSRILIAGLIAFQFLNAAVLWADDKKPTTKESDSEAKDDSAKKDTGHSFLVGTLLYVPNRLLDMLDIFRFKLRVGPGISAGVRATKAVEAYVGSYATVYAGLPGPRMRELPKLPIGLESHNGASVSVVDATVDGGIGPDYSPSEIGLGFQLGVIGLDFGLDPVEGVDLLTGLVTLDIRDDDL